MTTGTGQALENFRGLVEATALKVSRSPQAKRVGAEYDDLVQEGLIAVWQATGRGHNPVAVIENRMKDWLRFLGKRSGESYAQHMPLDDFRNLARAD